MRDFLFHTAPVPLMPELHELDARLLYCIERFVGDRSSNGNFPEINEVDAFIENLGIEVEIPVLKQPGYSIFRFGYRSEARIERFGEMSLLVFPAFPLDMFMEFARHYPVATALRLLVPLTLTANDEWYSAWGVHWLGKLLEDEQSCRIPLQETTHHIVALLKTLFGDALYFARSSTGQLLVAIDQLPTQVYQRLLARFVTYTFRVYPILGFIDNYGVSAVDMNANHLQTHFINGGGYFLSSTREVEFVAKAQVAARKRKLQALIAD